MKEIQFIGPTMAYEHASFQVFKNVNYHIGFISPKFMMLDRARQEIVFNIKAISSHVIERLTERVIQLSNGSRITFITQAQGDNSFRGYELDLVFMMFEPIPHEMKIALIPCLIKNPDSILYTVYDR